MKAGVTELPDVIAVTKADMVAARRTRADVEGALSLHAGARRAPVLLVAAARLEGLDELERALGDHRAWLMEGKRLVQKRDTQENLWVEQAIRARFGSVGVRAARAQEAASGGPFSREQAISRELLTRLGF